MSVVLVISGVWVRNVDHSGLLYKYQYRSSGGVKISVWGIALPVTVLIMGIKS